MPWFCCVVSSVLDWPTANPAQNRAITANVVDDKVRIRITIPLVLLNVVNSSLSGKVTHLSPCVETWAYCSLGKTNFALLAQEGKTELAVVREADS